MSDVGTIVQPFVQRGLFDSAEKAVAEMARDYVLRQVEQYRRTIKDLEDKYGMSYEQFEGYLKARVAQLETSHEPALNRAVMAEEEDALDWKIAREMLHSWLGLQSEVAA